MVKETIIVAEVEEVLNALRMQVDICGKQGGIKIDA